MPPGCSLFFQVFSSPKVHPKVHPNDPRQGARTWAVLILSDAMAPAMKCHLDILSQARTRNNWNWGRLWWLYQLYTSIYHLYQLCSYVIFGMLIICQLVIHPNDLGGYRERGEGCNYLSHPTKIKHPNLLGLNMKSNPILDQGFVLGQVVSWCCWYLGRSWKAFCLTGSTEAGEAWLLRPGDQGRHGSAFCWPKLCMCWYVLVLNAAAAACSSTLTCGGAILAWINSKPAHLGNVFTSSWNKKNWYCTCYNYSILTLVLYIYL